MKAGVLKRVGTRLPEICPATMRKFKKRVWKWCEQNLTPISKDADLEVPHWLDQTNYTANRKEQLKSVWERGPDIKDKKYHTCKSFMKDETYTEYKHARGIFSRTDEWKCFMGPIVKEIENAVYKHPAFIKHIPVADRPRYIMERLSRPGAKYFATDYTAFESSFKKMVMEMTSFILYKYMMKYHPRWTDMKFIMKVVGGKNKCVFKRFWFTVLATRMSGEMDTSLANGFANLMVAMFLCELTGCGEPTAVAEGDDGVFSTPTNRFPTPEDFAKLGFNIKIDTSDDLETASFCGLIFDRNELINVTNPLEVLFSTGWLTGRYAKSSRSTKLAILRCKALSIMHQYPGCPMLDRYARYIARTTREFHGTAVNIVTKKNVFNSYERTMYLHALSAEENAPIRVPGVATRQIITDKYGISMDDQVKFEMLCDQRTTLEPLDAPFLRKYLPPSWVDYYLRYWGNGVGDICRPPLNFPVLPVLMRYANSKESFDSYPIDHPDLLPKLRF